MMHTFVGDCRTADYRELSELRVLLQYCHVPVFHPLAVAEIQLSQPGCLHQVSEGLMTELCAAVKAQLLEPCTTIAAVV